MARLALSAANSAGLYRFFLYLVVALPPGLSLFPAVESGDWLAFYIAAACSAGLVLLAFAYQHSLRRELRRRLEASGLYLRLALDGFEHDSIFDKCPWPWNAMLPRNTRLSLLPTLRRISGNLDFYLHGPSYPLWLPRLAHSLCLILSVLLLLPTGFRPVIFLSNFQVFSVVHAWLSQQNLMQLDLFNWLVWLPFSLTAVFWFFRRQVWTEELVRYIQSQLQS